MLVDRTLTDYLCSMKPKTLTPEMETVLDMMAGLSREGQEKVMETLYDVVSEVEAEERWKTLLTEHPGPMEEMAAQALRDFRDKKTRPL